MSNISSVPFPPESWGVSLNEEYKAYDIASLLQTILQKISLCISARTSDNLNPFPYYTGSTLNQNNTILPVIQKYITWVVPNGGGSSTIPIDETSAILPIEIYGMGTSFNPSITSYPIGYNDGSTYLYAYFSSNNVTITASASMSGYMVTLVLKYVYYIAKI